MSDYLTMSQDGQIVVDWSYLESQTNEEYISRIRRFNSDMDIVSIEQLDKVSFQTILISECTAVIISYDSTNENEVHCEILSRSKVKLLAKLFNLTI